ncbi:unnamed protein product [Arctia plantaginis]|uniref:Uncharacterized protein n=1 Tax=Arctia plantaginis TaxID=874455 RepID=A0A8S1BI89_ARCPL|nr:unnamed protein product [Arctia plantaginis]
MRVAALLLSIACILLTVWACDPDQAHNGCKIYGASCTCGFGCRTEFNYRSKRACMNALRGYVLAATCWNSSSLYFVPQNGAQTYVVDFPAYVEFVFKRCKIPASLANVKEPDFMVNVVKKVVLA